jgi:hypothetical protein
MQLAATDAFESLQRHDDADAGEHGERARTDGSKLAPQRRPGKQHRHDDQHAPPDELERRQADQLAQDGREAPQQHAEVDLQQRLAFRSHGDVRPACSARHAAP